MCDGLRMCVLQILTISGFIHADAAPEPPTAVSVKDGAGCYSSVVSWVAPQARCGVAIATYSVRYQQRKGGGGGGYTTVSSPTTSVTLQRITANSDYDVSVAAISSSGDMGIFTKAIQFELQGDICTQLLLSAVIAHHHMHSHQLYGPFLLILQNQSHQQMSH